MNPVAWWESLPASVREPCKSATVATGMGLQNGALVLVGAAAADGHLTSPLDLVTYCAGHWWGVAVGVLLPAAYRARQGFIASTTPKGT